MIKILKNIFVLTLLFSTFISADSIFLLTKMKKIYLVVDNQSSKIPTNSTIKNDIYDELKNLAKELKIDSTGHSHRALGVLIYDTSIGDKFVLNVDLVLGEEVKRIDDGEDVYAFTYEKRKQFFIENKTVEEIEEKILDSVDILLVNFSKQYIEDNEWEFYL